MDLVASSSTRLDPAARRPFPSWSLPLALSLLLLSPAITGRGRARAAPPAARMTPSQVAFFEANPGLATAWNHTTGAPRSLRGFSESVSGNAVGAASRFLDRIKEVLRIDSLGSQLRFSRMHDDELGYQHLRFRQVHAGIPVESAVVSVHIDPGRRIYQVDSDFLPDLDVSTVPTVTADGALQAAMARMTGKHDVALRDAPSLVIRTFGPFTAHLVWQLSLSCSGPGRARLHRFHVDARSGRVVWHGDGIRAIADPTTNGSVESLTGDRLAGEDGTRVTVRGWHDTTNAAWYLYNREAAWSIRNAWMTTWTPPYADSQTHAHRTTSAAWGASDPAEMSAALNLATTQDFVRTVLGRNGMDGAGKLAVANVHTGIGGVPEIGAYYDTTTQQIYLGDGDGVQFLPAGVLDLVGHEYGHAIDTFSSDPFYRFESGALDEGYADIYGVAVELHAQPDGRSLYPGTAAGQSDWLVGEDSFPHAVRQAIRDLRDPKGTATLLEADRLPSRYHGPYWRDTALNWDLGGIHYNGGPLGFAFYLVSEGGKGDNDGVPYDIRGIGWRDAIRVAHRGNTSYLLTQDWTYLKARGAWISAAKDLQGTNDWVTTVERAFDAIGVTEIPTQCAQGFEQDALPSGWVTGGDATWSVTTTHVQGTRSVHAGAVTTRQSSYLETTVSPTVTTLLTFAWMTSSQPGVDRLTLTVDGSRAGEFSGGCAWASFGVSLTAAPHTLRWTYAKGDEGPAGLDTVWIDAVDYRPLAAPSAPTSLTAVAKGFCDVQLTWADNSADETGFRVERKTGLGGTYSQVATVGAGVTRCIDAGLAYSTTYYYRVFAFNESGDSLSTEEVRVTTPGPYLGSGDPSGGGCFIATAAYGSAMAPQVSSLRRFRDRWLLPSDPGRELVAAYYRYSPPLAAIIRRDEALRAAARWALSPLVWLVGCIDGPPASASPGRVTSTCDTARRRRAARRR